MGGAARKYVETGAVDRWRVLVLETSHRARQELYDLLALDFDVQSAETGKDALEALKSTGFDVFIFGTEPYPTDAAAFMKVAQGLRPDVLCVLLSDANLLDSHGDAADFLTLPRPWSKLHSRTLSATATRQKDLVQAKADLAAERELRQHAEATAVHLDRLASLGTLSAGVAHELRTPLAFLTANLSFLGKEFTTRLEAAGDQGSMQKSPDSPLSASFQEWAEYQDTVADCMEGVRRLGEIVDSLRDHVRPGRAYGNVPIFRCVDNAVRLVRFQYKHAVRINVHPIADLGTVKGDAGELAQILINLLVNAIQAMGHAGEIDIRVSENENGSGIEIRVSDQGPGVPPHVVPHLFEPFYTTKGAENSDLEVGAPREVSAHPPVVGTGLGLSISRSIAQRHGGGLCYEETTDGSGGATFVLSLPYAKS